MGTNGVPWRVLTVPNLRGEKLIGILDDTGSDHIVVLCHGFRSSKEDAVLVSLASAFVSRGISTFRFDFSGSGESEGEFQYGSYWKDAEDLKSVISYLRTEGRKVMALVGHSKGGNAVLLYASKYKDVEILVNISGRFHLERGITKRLGRNYLDVINKQCFLEVRDRYGNVEYLVTKDSLKERLATNMESAVASIPEYCRVLTVHGSKDETVHPDEAKEFARHILKHSLRILDNADHYFRQHQRPLAQIVVDFVETELLKCTSVKRRTSSENKRNIVSKL